MRHETRTLYSWLLAASRAYPCRRTPALAVHFFTAYQGMAAVALGANDREVVVMEAKRLKDWIGTL